MTTQQPVTTQTRYGVVKQVTSGDTIVIKGNPKKTGPPEEITIVLTGLQVPKLARRPTNTVEETKDEPFAWEAREYLRQRLVGKKVLFTFEKAKSSGEKSSSGSREFGIVYNGLDANCENVAESLINEGLASVRSNASQRNEYIKKLSELENIAKAAGKGKHGPNAAEHIRDVKWTIDNPQIFKDSFHQKPVKAIVEHVVDGSTLRVVLQPNESNEFYYIKLMLSGIRCNGFPLEDSNKPPEPYAEEARYYTETRLLQRDIEVLLESVSNKNFLGTVLHPKGNITELLLTEGFAKCVDWSLQCLTSGIDKLRAAEKLAKERRLRIWKEYTPSGPVIDAKDKEFTGKVIEIINADAMNVKLADGSIKKIFLASIRPPRLPDTAPKAPRGPGKPLYEVPYMFEAREFLRKKLIGKKVNVTVDYIQPQNMTYPAKTCCTVTIGGINVAEALVSKGLATVLRYRADDDQRSAHYDELLSAETKAAKSGKGLHSKKDPPVIRIVELAGEKLTKQYFPLVQRLGRTEALVEFVASGSRLRLFLPRQNYLITFLLGGISCPRPSRDTITPEENFGDEALAYTKDLCHQKEVQIEVEAMDKGGNFIGWLWADNINLSEALVKEGFAEVFATASKSSYYRALQAAEDEAKKKKLRRWELYDMVQAYEKKQEVTDRVIKYKTVTITETKEDASNLTFWAQSYDKGPELDELMAELREEFKNNPPYPGNYEPHKNDFCAAKYSVDGQWYRAATLKVTKEGALMLFVDFGNREILPPSSIAALPSKYKELEFCANEYSLAFVKLPNDPDSASDARAAFFDEAVQHPRLKLNWEYSPCHVTLVTDDEKEDIGKKLVEKGYLLVDRKPEKKYSKLINEYLVAQEKAKKNRKNLWVYGDITDDDAKEFG